MLENKKQSEDKDEEASSDESGSDEEMIRKETSQLPDSDNEIEIVKADNHAATNMNQSSLYTSLL